MPKRLTQEECLRRFNNTHGETYNYEKVIYTKKDEKVTIGCFKHGDFLQRPNDHWRGDGCPKCGNERIAESKKHTIDSLLSLFRERQGNYYDYSKVKYVDQYTPIIIICPKHGEFTQRPVDHIQRKGCKKCGKSTQVEKRTYKLADVIKLFKDVHGDFYDYSKVIYVNSQTKVTVGCPAHGDFLIRPDTHINRKCGCRKCYDDRQRENATDLTDKRFGKLTVIKRVPKPKHRRRDNVFWKVKCGCGSDPFIVTSGDLTGKKAFQQCRKCSFLATAKTRRQQGEDNLLAIFANKFYALRVIREWGRNKVGKRKVLCQCDCGNQTITVLEYILCEDTKSCGCRTSGVDSYMGFKEDEEWANSDCYFYIADIDDEFIKPGIAIDLKARKSNGKYRGYEFDRSPLLSRCEAWTIEQIILNESIDSFPDILPKKFHNYEGYSELRLRSGFAKDFYRRRFFELLETMYSIGWEDMYLKNQF